MMDQPGKSLVLLVHGFSDNEDCWKPLRTWWEEKSELTARFDFVPFSYLTRKVPFDLLTLTRIPALLEVAEDLADCIATKMRGGGYAEVVLVGHSMGGLVIQQYFALKLKNGEAADLRIIRQALFIATPNEGSITLKNVRKLFSEVLEQPQEESLRIFNPEVDEVGRAIAKNIVDATAKSAHQWPVPIHVFWGSSDNVVPMASARAGFPVATALKGNHFTVIQPKKADGDADFIKITDALLRPAGHKHVHEFDSYETVVAVKPLAANAIYHPNCCGQPRDIVTDNYARLTRTAAVSEQNICEGKLRFNYRVNREGFLDQRIEYVPVIPSENAPENEVRKSDIGRYQDSNCTEATFEITPQKSRTYREILDIWKGFDDKRRDLHFHFDNMLRCAVYRFRVDLSAYVRADWTVTVPPRLCMFWQDTECGKLCRELRDRSDPIPPKNADQVAGIWDWEIPNFGGGVVDASWDVAPPAAAAL